MIDINLIRKTPEHVKNACLRRGETIPIEEILEIDKIKRDSLSKASELRAHRNKVSRDIGLSKKASPEIIDQMKQIGQDIKKLDIVIRDTTKKLEDLLLSIPNIPDTKVPDGLDDTNNKLIDTHGSPQKFKFTLSPHWDLAKNLDIIDFERGTKLSASRFYILKGKGAKLQRSLISWMIDIHTANGYQDLYLPYLVNRQTALGSGQLPKFYENMYHDTEDDLWLIPTAEVPITNLYRDEILDYKDLPLNFVAHTPCFRREKANAGKDTRGIKRVHQFEKVEMYKFVEPENSEKELMLLLSHAQEICKLLDIPYRTIQMCAGNLGFASSISYDIEIWASGSAEWLEISSCSNCKDFQSIRSNIRFRNKETNKPEFVHTINGSGLSLPRLLIAILENGQTEDGSVHIPKILHPYTQFERID